jgi:hypothetical protein
MPHFVLNHSQLGPIIDVFVGVSAQRLAAITKAGGTAPGPILVKALVDTGASHTSFDVDLVGQLGLTTPTGVVSVITPSTGATPHEMFSYDLSFHVPFPDTSIWSRPLWIATAAELKHQGFSVLLGRDLLAEAILIYDGKHGTFTLSF